MKKNMMRIFATANAVVALVFVIVLLVTAFGGISVEEFDNSLVKGLFISLGVIYLLLTGVTLAMLFINDELVKEIVLRSDKEGGTRTTVGVVKKITKNTAALVEGVKCSKCAVVVNEYGVRLKITVVVRERDVREVENYLRALLEDAFMGALNFRFYSIEIKVKKLKPNHKVDAVRIMADADEAEKVRLAEEAERLEKEKSEKAEAEEKVKALVAADQAQEDADIAGADDVASDGENNDDAAESLSEDTEENAESDGAEDNGEETAEADESEPEERKD